MQYQAAVSKARKQAKRTGEERFIVLSPEECDRAGEYQVSTAEELQTFFSGAEVIACLDPSGEVER